MKILKTTMISSLSLASFNSTDVMRNCTIGRRQTAWVSMHGGFGNKTIPDCPKVKVAMGAHKTCFQNKTYLQASAAQSVQSANEHIDKPPNPVISGVKRMVKKTSTHVVTATATRSNHTISTTTTLTRGTVSTEPSPLRGNEAGQLKGYNPPEIEALLSDQARNADTAWVTETSVATCMIPETVY